MIIDRIATLLKRKRAAASLSIKFERSATFELPERILLNGAEWGIFEDRQSWQCVKHLAMEYHLFEPDHSEERVKSIVTSLGFSILSFTPIENYGLLLASLDCRTL